MSSCPLKLGSMMVSFLVRDGVGADSQVTDAKQNCSVKRFGNIPGGRALLLHNRKERKYS